MTTNPRINIAPISIIVALDEDAGFGKDGKIPWYYTEDLKRFKEITTGHICVMGRKTYSDMLEMIKTRREAKGDTSPITEILPNRQCFVVTSNKDFEAPGATVVSSLREAVHSLDQTDTRTVFVIGGYRMFVEALTWTDTVYITMIPGRHACDLFFPIKTINSKYVIKDLKKEGELTFVTYKRTVA